MVPQPLPSSQCPGCGAVAAPRYTLLSGAMIAYVCPDCELEFEELEPGRGKHGEAARQDLEFTDQFARICLGESKTSRLPGRNRPAVVRLTSSVSNTRKSGHPNVPGGTS